MASNPFPSQLYALAMAGQVACLIVGLKFPKLEVRLACFGLIALFALLVWIAAFHRRRAILDTPISRVGSAAQGYVELQGNGQLLEGVPLLAPLSSRACLWYRYRLEERNGDNDWRQLEGGVSTNCFVINDGSGQCMVDPEGAEVLTMHHKVWLDGDKRCHEWWLQANDKVSVLGDFVTLRQSDELDSDADVSALLADWKKDKAALLRRFDLDHSGEIDLKEWEWARRAARNEVNKRHQEMRAQDALNMIRLPKARMFLITNYEPERLARRFLWLGAFQIVCFFAALWALGMWWRGTWGTI